jgi:deoxyadenosine/deoxycytidine kinase
MLKISFSGIPGSGRSSLAQEVRKILALKSKVELIDAINNKNPFDDHQRSSFESQFFYISTQMNEENTHMFSPLDYLLCDQSVLDQWVTWLCIFDKQKDKTSQRLAERQHLMQTLYRYWIETYDIIFLVRVSQDLFSQRQAQNRLRPSNGINFEDRDQWYQKTILEDHLRVIEIWNNTSIDEAAHQMIRQIQDHSQHRQNKKSVGIAVG